MGYFGVPRAHALATKGGTLAAATVLAGAGLVGVATVGPDIPGAPFAVHAHHVVPTAFPTFAESLQNLLNDLGWGDLNAVLAGFGDSLGVTTPLSVDSDVSALLAALNPDGLTLNGVTNLFGISLTEPLYSTTVDSILGQGSLFLVDGVPIGNLELGQLIDVVLGAGAGEHSLTDLANAVGLGSLLDQYADAINAGNGLLGVVENMNILNCSALSICNHPNLGTDDSLNDWLSGLLKVSTTEVTRNGYVFGIPTGSDPHYAPATTLGEYLHTLDVSPTDTTPLDQATLGDLFGLPPNQPWDEYLSGLPFGGTLLDPSGETLGEQTLGDFLSSFLPDGSTLTIDGDTPITDILEALGLLSW